MIKINQITPQIRQVNLMLHDKVNRTKNKLQIIKFTMCFSSSFILPSFGNIYSLFPEQAGIKCFLICLFCQGLRLFSSYYFLSKKKYWAPGRNDRVKDKTHTLKHAHKGWFHFIYEDILTDRQIDEYLFTISKSKNIVDNHRASLTWA